MQTNTPTMFFQVAQLCSQIVFLILRVGFKHANLFWKHYKNSGFSKIRNNQNDRKLSKTKVNDWFKHKSKIGPQACYAT